MFLTRLIHLVPLDDIAHSLDVARDFVAHLSRVFDEFHRICDRFQTVRVQFLVIFRGEISVNLKIEFIKFVQF